MDAEDESTQLMTVNIYDTHSATTILKVNSETRACDICKAIAHKFDISSDNAKFHSLVLVLTAYNSANKYNTHCVRTLTQNECPLDIRGILISKLIDKYNISDAKEVANTVRWYYKDIRTSPIEFGDSGEVSGEYSSDDEEVISHSDLAYLAKAERKGYLLKRSSKDQNLWRRWYCALTDHLWCVDINRDDPRAICIKLSGMIRYKQGNHSTLDQVQTIIINSLKQTHFFRAFNVVEHRKWIEDLYVKTNYATDNDYFSMAEVIICDEELTKSKRIHKQVQDLLDLDMVYECLAEQRLFSLPARQLPGQQYPEETPSVIPMAALDSAVTPLKASGGTTSSSSRQSPAPLTIATLSSVPSDAQFVSDLAAAVDDLMIATLNDESTHQYTRDRSEEYRRSAAGGGAGGAGYDSLRSSAAHTPLSRSTGSFASVINSTNTAADIAFSSSSGASGGDEAVAALRVGDTAEGEEEQEEGQQSRGGRPSSIRPRATTTGTAIHTSSSFSSAPAAPPVPRSLNPLDRSRRHSLTHRLHHKNKLLYRMLSFLLEVQFFKEMFRHDLVVTSNEQIERATVLHSRYLVPQLLAAGLFLGSSFIAQYANRMTATPVKRSRGASAAPAMAVNIKANGTIVMTPKGAGGAGGVGGVGGSGRQRGTSRTERSPVGSFGEPDSSARSNMGRSSSKKITASSTSARHSRNSSRTDLEAEAELESQWANGNNSKEEGETEGPGGSRRVASVQWGISIEALLKIHLILFDTQDISSEDIDKYGLTGFVSTLNSIKSTINDSALESRGKSSKKGGAEAGSASVAAAAPTGSFWSLFSSPSTPSTANQRVTSQQTSGKEQAAVERVPVGSDLFDEAVTQLMEVMKRKG